MQTTSTGDQINQRIDIQKVGREFVNYYFTNCKSNFQAIISSGIFREHTRIRYKEKEYKNQELVNLLSGLNQQLTFMLEEIVIMDSGGRRADILVVGKVQDLKSLEKIYRFSQYFTIANNKNGHWFLHNSLLSILDL